VSEIAARLEELERLGLGRRLRMISGPQGATVVLDGKPVLLLCSNNYLGLADHPRVREAAADAAMRWGVGAGASRLVSGTMTVHRRLEERLAAFEGAEACVLFGSGYLANAGVIGALAGQGGVVLSDELNHASIIDGCRLSRAEVVVYRHCDVDHLEWCLRKHGARGEEAERPLIVTDSVFSMDGDVAPLTDIAELAQVYGARLVVDEAHATGNLGPGGRGAVAQAGLEDEVDVVVGTLGKALGSYGAYACASAELVQYLINVARPLIFSTAPPPPSVAGALAALELLQERPHRVQRLRGNARVLRRALAAEGFPVADLEMHIVPLIVGEERAAMRLCQEAIEEGIFAQAIRPPTVPPGTARLRLTAMASHTASELRMAAEALGAIARRLGLDPAAMSPALPERALSAYEQEQRLREQAEREAPHEQPPEWAPRVLSAAEPFDFERDGAASAASAGRSALPFDFERDAEPASPGAAPPAAASGVEPGRDGLPPTAPFDVEDADRLPPTAPFDVEREQAHAA
jgi:glycine C-acetyltransferase/8-amino-7-oxononanoate synthase